MRMACKLDNPRILCACFVVCMFVSGQVVSLCALVLVSCCGLKQKESAVKEKPKSGQFALMATIHHRVKRHGHYIERSGSIRQCGKRHAVSRGCEMT